MKFLFSLFILSLIAFSHIGCAASQPKLSAVQEMAAEQDMLKSNESVEPTFYLRTTTEGDTTSVNVIGAMSLTRTQFEQFMAMSLENPTKLEIMPRKSAYLFEIQVSAPSNSSRLQSFMRTCVQLQDNLKK